MNRRGSAVWGAAALLFVAVSARAGDFTVTGSFLYEDRVWNGAGYTGAVRDLPIRRADVEVVNEATGTVLAAGSTATDGTYAIPVTGQSGTLELYVRCLSATERAANYHIQVVDTFTRTGGTLDLTGSAVHAITTSVLEHDTASPVLAMGAYLIRDLTGAGVAQAFNILDAAVDAFDYVAQPFAVGRYPAPAESLVFAWNGSAGPAGTNYLWQGINVTSTTSDNDGWSDAVVLHETGHWAADMYSDDNSPGGAHYLGDIAQDPRLSYGEGHATYFAGQVREFRAGRFVGGQPVDAHVSLYADLAIAPAVGTPGGLEFSFDYETGLYTPTGIPVGQLGGACETNVTAALWDLLDGSATPDESPGQDDDPGDETGAGSWPVLTGYLTTLSPWDPITVEDFYEGWFQVHGPGYQQAAVNAAFLTLAGMPFAADALEPDNDTTSAVTVSVLAYAPTGGGVVINECELGYEDQVELQNTGTSPVSLTGWRIVTSRNGYTTTTYTFPSFTLYPGSFVVVHEGGSTANNGPVHLWGGTFTIPWFNTDDGACTLRNALNNPVDFVRWDNVNGTDPSTTAVPPGQTFLGSLFSVPVGTTLARNANGTDTQQAPDFTARPPSLDAPNPDSVPARTLYPEGDPDVVRFHATSGQLLGVRAESPHSAGEPRLELRNAAGDLLATNVRAHGIPRLAELVFLVPASGTYYVTVRHAGPYTDWAPLRLMAYRRPTAQVLGPPSGLVAVPDNAADVGDRVVLTWLCGGAYDSVRVVRDGTPVVTLPGAATQVTDFVDRGQHVYTVTGWLQGSQSAAVSAPAFTGLLTCHLEEGLESGTAVLDLDAPWGLVSSPALGLWALTDSPTGSYASNRNVSAEIVVPSKINVYPRITFDHICITEEDYDFGIVEASADFGNTWSELARYDMGDHPGWADGTADPGDWVHETIDLNPFLGEKVTVRFRLWTDASVVADGWYVDNIAVSDTACAAITAVAPVAARGPFLRAGPNPFQGSLELTLDALLGTDVRIEVFDVVGRRVRLLHEGPLGTGVLSWDGCDETRRPAASGVYLVRAAGAGQVAVRRVVKLVR